MSEDRLNKLLDEMPRIADAVNSFSSPEVQRDAFASLMRAAGDELPNEFHASGDTHNELQTATEQVKSKPKKAPLGTTKKATAAKSSKKGKLPAVPVDEALDIRPSGKTSLPDFADEKEPKSLQDRSMVIIYWLKNHAARDQVGLSQIHTCYKNMGWKSPANPRNHLHDIAFKKKWLNTSDIEEVTLTHTGDQHVEHDLPPRSAG